MKKLFLCLPLLWLGCSESAEAPEEGPHPAYTESAARLPVKLQTQWGVVDQTGKYLIEPVHPLTLTTAGEGYRMESPMGVQFLMEGGEPFPAEPLAAAGYFVEGLAPAVREAQVGFIDTQGKWAIPDRFEAAQHFSEGLAAVKEKGKWGFIGKDGEWKIKAIYEEEPGPMMSGRAAVSYDGVYGFIDSAGALIVNPQFKEPAVFTEGLAAVNVDRKWGFLNLNGELAIPAEFVHAGHFSEGRAMAKKDNKVGYLNAQGSWAIPAKYDDGAPFMEGLAAVRQDGKWGYLDHTGQWAIKPAFQQAGVFTAGAALVMQDRKWGLIDRKGNFLARPQWTGVDVDFALAGPHWPWFRLGDAWKVEATFTAGYVARTFMQAMAAGDKNGAEAWAGRKLKESIGMLIDRQGPWPKEGLDSLQIVKRQGKTVAILQDSTGGGWLLYLVSSRDNWSVEEVRKESVLSPETEAGE